MPVDHFSFLPPEIFYTIMVMANISVSGLSLLPSVCKYIRDLVVPLIGLESPFWRDAFVKHHAHAEKLWRFDLFKLYISRPGLTFIDPPTRSLVNAYKQLFFLASVGTWSQALGSYLPSIRVCVRLPQPASPDVDARAHYRNTNLFGYGRRLDCPRGLYNLVRHWLEGRYEGGSRVPGLRDLSGWGKPGWVPPTTGYSTPLVDPIRSLDELPDGITIWDLHPSCRNFYDPANSYTGVIRFTFENFAHLQWFFESIWNAYLPSGMPIKHHTPLGITYIYLSMKQLFIAPLKPIF